MRLARELHSCSGMIARLLVPCVPLLLGLACSSNDINLTDTAPTDTDPPTDTDLDTGEAPGPDPVWFSVDGLLHVRDGALTEASALEIGMWSKHQDGSPMLGCVDRLQVLGAPVAQPADPVELYGTWEIPLAGGTCAGRPTRVTLGIGPLLADLWPAAEQLEVSLRQTRGLYLAADAELFVFGLAATADQAAGLGAPPSLDPLPDGAYHLRGIWLLPL